MERIPYNKPYLTGKEVDYIRQAVSGGKISGDGAFTAKCHRFFEKRFGFKKVLLTTSCTDALEMTAILAEIQQGDEVIIPSFTFVSTANAFVLRGARIVFADSSPDIPNIDTGKLEDLITPRSKAIVPVHYAGVACDMEPIMALARKYGLYVIEDAAAAIDSYYKVRPLGSIGHLATFSFHETKNIISGEGGMLVINDERFSRRAEIIWEKGTNRSAFKRGEVDRYVWMDIGSSFFPSDITAAYLWAQIEKIDDIQSRRKAIWDSYYEGLKPLEEEELIRLPFIPAYATNNAHMFYMVCRSLEERTSLIDFLGKRNIKAIFHYLPLHRSPFYQDKHDGRQLPICDMYSDCLVRLPLYYEMTDCQAEKVIDNIFDFFGVIQKDTS